MRRFPEAEAFAITIKMPERNLRLLLTSVFAPESERMLFAIVGSPAIISHCSRL
jgi:hypothetical protein